MRDLLPKTKKKQKQKIYLGEINKMKLWSWAD
jgi:hypothetical protein